VAAFVARRLLLSTAKMQSRHVFNATESAAALTPLSLNGIAYNVRFLGLYHWAL
jgi:hypothetical protein